MKTISSSIKIFLFQQIVVASIYKTYLKCCTTKYCHFKQHFYHFHKIKSSFSTIDCVRSILFPTIKDQYLFVALLLYFFATKWWSIWLAGACPSPFLYAFTYFLLWYALNMDVEKDIMDACLYFTFFHRILLGMERKEKRLLCHHGHALFLFWSQVVIFVMGNPQQSNAKK